MSAINFLENRPKITAYSAMKIKKQQEQTKKKDNRKLNDLPKADQLKLRKHLTWIANSIEFISDNIDDINEILPNTMTKTLFNDFQEVILPLNEMFIKNAQKTEQEDMERIIQQKEFESLMRLITDLKPKQFDMLVDYSKNLKNKN